jgi:hypothetical protein
VNGISTKTRRTVETEKDERNEQAKKRMEENEKERRNGKKKI